MKQRSKSKSFSIQTPILKIVIVWTVFHGSVRKGLRLRQSHEESCEQLHSGVHPGGYGQHRGDAQRSSDGILGYQGRQGIKTCIYELADLRRSRAGIRL